MKKLQPKLPKKTAYWITQEEEKSQQRSGLINISTISQTQENTIPAHSVLSLGYVSFVSDKPISMGDESRFRLLF